MKVLQSLLIAFATNVFRATVSARPTLEAPLYELQTVHQFANLTWIENIGIRANGQILATDVGSSRLFLVDPNNTTQASPPVIHQFLRGTTISGLVEVEDDVFYTIGSLESNVYNFTFAKNTTKIWQIDLREYSVTGNTTVSEILALPKVDVGNGLTLLSKQDGTILIADSEGGLVWILNVHTGEYSIAIDHPFLKPIPSAHPPFGVNGLKVIGSDLYFSNTNKGLLGKFPISLKKASPTGQPTLVSNNTPAADDFAVGPDGSVWLTENVRNTLVRVSPNGNITTIAGGVNSTALVGPVAAKFGRGRWDKHVLYVSTDGLLLDAKGNALSTAGKIVAVDTSACEI
ncbi:hypothetical protein H2200_012378 [Cladophialophora chaetospira]|uniref:SMP-30/Gluconolactonase/LRE-like region domain-containing protein n=1 Tax=Cladophialophora chaetospira TaxID=386627 RepID=A0AA38WXR8_9EURO|nr:hypothetical protein H2200_012378 [Cladophialophora chaetospira]